MRRAGNIAPEQGNRSRQPTIRAPSAADLQVQAEPHPGVPLSPGTKRHSDANQQHVSPCCRPPFAPPVWVKIWRTVREDAGSHNEFACPLESFSVPTVLNRPNYGTSAPPVVRMLQNVPIRAA